MPTPPPAPGNRYAFDQRAIQLGKTLFFDPRLSRSGDVACASCHRPDQYFTDGKVRALGADIGKRNTPSLQGVAYNTWFFWDGRKDSLWSQALAPLENPVEHDFSRTELVQLLLKDKQYLSSYTALFGAPQQEQLASLPAQAQPSGTLEQIKAWKSLSQPQRDAIDQVFANLGKALAAFVTTLPPVTTRFDDYVAALSHGEDGNTALSTEEQQGLRLFISPDKQCLNCHFGPLLTNQDFHNVGTGRAGIDSGRAAALDNVRLDRFNCLGAYSDAGPDDCRDLQFMQRDRHALWGAFKTPTLRNVSNTPPYFHDGRSPDLGAVLDHYTQLKPGEAHLQPITLTGDEKQALLAFLKALAAKPTAQAQLTVPALK
ncbi:MAG: cytochrome c peroxidase [Thiolinea sp.]